MKYTANVMKMFDAASRVIVAARDRMEVICGKENVSRGVKF